eukprot:TRINITY_DN9534_c0_g2_i1.p1 TRINITY_DN9534_c0_g2~~TRINITY_DN9534_c0_g2_i1.p1  ORF type:complete len:853 (-),score=177.75 TRINITY_DN9534_c0_g2_i1:151-2709(-)
MDVFASGGDEEQGEESEEEESSAVPEADEEVVEVGEVLFHDDDVVDVAEELTAGDMVVTQDAYFYGALEVNSAAQEEVTAEEMQEGEAEMEPFIEEEGDDGMLALTETTEEARFLDAGENDTEEATGFELEIENIEVDTTEMDADIDVRQVALALKNVSSPADDEIRGEGGGDLGSDSSRIADVVDASGELVHDGIARAAADEMLDDDFMLFFEDVKSARKTPQDSSASELQLPDGVAGSSGEANALNDDGSASASAVNDSTCGHDASCESCGLPGHTTASCPFGHPEDIELCDLEESDSDDDLAQRHPLLGRYISMHIGAVTPKYRKGANIPAGSRYFLGSRTESVCWACAQSGHDASGCPEKRCFFCAERGHDGRECPHRQQHCFHCETRGHLPTKCPTAASREPVPLTGTRCLRCGGHGHANCGQPPLLIEQASSLALVASSSSLPSSLTKSPAPGTILPKGDSFNSGMMSSVRPPLGPVGRMPVFGASSNFQNMVPSVRVPLLAPAAPPPPLCSQALPQSVLPNPHQMLSQLSPQIQRQRLSLPPPRNPAGFASALPVAATVLGPLAESCSPPQLQAPQSCIAVAATAIVSEPFSGVCPRPPPPPAKPVRLLQYLRSGTMPVGPQTPAEAPTGLLHKAVGGCVGSCPAVVISSASDIYVASESKSTAFGRRALDMSTRMIAEGIAGATAKMAATPRILSPPTLHLQEPVQQQLEQQQQQQHHQIKIATTAKSAARFLVANGASWQGGGDSMDAAASASDGCDSSRIIVATSSRTDSTTAKSAGAVALHVGAAVGQLPPAAGKRKRRATHDVASVSPAKKHVTHPNDSLASKIVLGLNLPTDYEVEVCD